MANQKYTEEELDKMQREAVRRGREAMESEIRAKQARYDKESNRLILDLENGATFILPIDLMQSLRGAKAEDLAEVEVWSNGAALHWEKLDADFRVPALLQGIFGGKTWMRELREHYAEIGGRGGASKSESKITASRENGKKGGRPRKAA